MFNVEGDRGAQLVALWPVLPFLGFGFCGAWFALADGTVWLSPVESDGVALTNLNIVLRIAMGLALLLVCALNGFGAGRLRGFVEGRAVVWLAGGTAAAGSLLLILVGPAYFQTALGSLTRALFQVASAMLGVGFGLLFLRLGVRYSALPLRRAMLYLCYSQLMSVFVYLAVRVSPAWTPAGGGPAFALIVAFVALPLLASASLCLSPSGGMRLAGQRQAAPTSSADERVSRRASAYFAIVLFLFAFVQAAVTANVTNSVAPSETLGGSNLAMLVRVPLLLGFALFAATLEARRFNFSALFIALIVMLELLVVLALVVNVRVGGWVVWVKCAAFAFELLTWFLLFAVAGGHRRFSAETIALNYGVYALGTGLGILAGVGVPGLVGASAFYIACVIVLLPAFLLLSEKNIDGLFLGARVGSSSFEEALGGRLRGNAVRAKGDFARRLDAFAGEHGLSARESEALRYLVAGRGDNQIAESMGISYNTARTHVRNVYGKLGVHDRQRLIDVINEAIR